LKGPTVDSNSAAVEGRVWYKPDLAGAADGVVLELRLHFRLRERQAMSIFVRSLLREQHFRKALECLDRRDGILFGDVREDRFIQTLRIDLARHCQDLARQHDATKGQHANQRHARKHFC